jgi:hypothetical protein
MLRGSSFNEVFVTDLTVTDTWRASGMSVNGGGGAVDAVVRTKSVGVQRRSGRFVAATAGAGTAS